MKPGALSRSIRSTDSALAKAGNQYISLKANFLAMYLLLFVIWVGQPLIKRQQQICRR
jgi:hypothetical protein